MSDEQAKLKGVPEIERRIKWVQAVWHELRTSTDNKFNDAFNLRVRLAHSP